MKVADKHRENLWYDGLAQMALGAAAVKLEYSRDPRASGSRKVSRAMLAKAVVADIMAVSLARGAATIEKVRAKRMSKPKPAPGRYEND